MNQLLFHDHTQESEEAGFKKILATDGNHPYMAAWWPPGHIIGYEHTFTHQAYDVLQRGNLFGNSQHILGALRVSRFSLLDSVYACQLSKDQRFLFTANRGLNHITVYDYPSNTIRLRAPMPDIQDFVPGLSPMADPRLGFHHGALVS